MDRRTYLRWAIPAGVGVAAAGCSAAPDVGGRPKTLLGVYSGATPLRPLERWLGRRHAVVVVYVNGNRSRRGVDRFVEEQLTSLWDRGHVPMITWEPYIGSPEETPSDVERRIRDGDYDRFVTRWVEALSSWFDADPARRAYFRPLPEMNGDWVPWSADPGGAGAFVGAWRRLHDAFADAGVGSDRMRWVWNPNALGTSGVGTEAYYPGGEYVDWVGVDGYNFGDAAASRWQSPAEVFDPMLSRLRSLTDKPVAFPEFGSSSRKNGAHRPDAKAAWIADAFDLIADRDVRMACWFNVDKETDWAVFGGGRGTHRASIDGRDYRTYRRYRRAVLDDRFAAGSPGGRALSDAAFAGRF